MQEADERSKGNLNKKVGFAIPRKDVVIDVIAFNIKDSDELEQLECTALVTSGRFYNAHTEAELLESFNNSIEGVKNVEAKIILPK